MRSNMATAQGVIPQKRHKCFEETHQEIIETAVRLISEKGLEAVSIAAVARELGINRTTVYYHFANRDDLIAEVKAWSSEQLARAFRKDRSYQERINHITRFVLENPDIMKLWIEDLVSPGDIRGSYPHWDELVGGIREHFAGEDVDVEIFCLNLLLTAIIGPRVMKGSVASEQSDADILARYQQHTVRMLQGAGLLGGEV